MPYVVGVRGRRTATTWVVQVVVHRVTTYTNTARKVCHACTTSRRCRLVRILTERCQELIITRDIFTGV